jgi:prepilin-type N-terminal cleavage/methylation domain-containing protein
MKLFQNKIQRGFTLIEILLVVAILSILLVVVFAALNPATRLADTRNANRWNAVNQYLTAIHECLVDNGGVYADCGLTNDGTTREITNAGINSACNSVCTGVTATGNCADLETELVTGQNYLSSLPTDPGGVATDHTEYTVTVQSGIVTIASCSAENGETVTVAR